VIKTDSKDGKTEWFLVAIDEIKEAIECIRKAMHYIHKDRLGW
jgi:hypothetical protein